MCSWWFVFDHSDDFLLCSYQWLDVLFLGVVCAPDGNGTNEVRVGVGVVELCHCVCCEKLLGVLQLLDGRL